MTEFEWRMKRVKHAVLIPFEWIGIVVALAVIACLPRRGLWAFCDVLSVVMFCFDRRGKRQALENLRIVRGQRRDITSIFQLDPDKTKFDATASELRILRRSYRNMARTVGYAFWTCIRAKARCAETGIMSEPAKEFLAANKPAVTVSGHIGCWEILSQLAYLEGHQMMSVAKNIGTRGMTALLMRARRSIGQEIVPAGGAFKPLMQGLRDGKSLGLLVDQRVDPKDGGIWVRLFGVPMAVSAAPAFFAAKGKAPIVVAWSRPLHDGRYRCELIDTISSEEARDIWETTQRIAADLARIIRRHPSCWVLNYDFFGNRPRMEDLKLLVEREAKVV